MTTSEYAEKVANLIQARPRKIDADKLLYEIYVKVKIAEGLRAVEEGRVYSDDEVVEDMWKIINSKSTGALRVFLTPPPQPEGMGLKRARPLKRHTLIKNQVMHPNQVERAGEAGLRKNHLVFLSQRSIKATVATSAFTCRCFPIQFAEY